MLPKLLDVPISTYLMVLAKIRRPSTTPSASTSRSFSSRMTSAASLATSVAESTEMPTSACVQGEGVVDAVAEERHVAARAPLDAHDAGLLFGADPGEDRGGRDRGGSCSSSRASRSAPVSVGAGRRPRSRQTFSATSGLSPVTILTVMPSPASRAQCLGGVVFGLVEEDQQAGQVQVVFVGGGQRGQVGAARVATATTRLPAVNSASSAAVPRRGHRRSGPVPTRVRLW